LFEEHDSVKHVRSLVDELLLVLRATRHDHKETLMGLRKRMALIMALAVLSVAASAVAAGANVERYEYVDYELTITSVNGDPAYWHDFSIAYDPDDDSYEGSGTYSGGSEAPSGYAATDDMLSFQSDYDTDAYTWYPSFVLEEDLTLTFVDGFGGDNVTAAEGTYTATEYKNHGQFVREAEDKKSAAHSLIGMPTKSKKNR
jgi:hypothetical protein